MKTEDWVILVAHGVTSIHFEQSQLNRFCETLKVYHVVHRIAHTAPGSEPDETILHTPASNLFI